MTYEYRAIITCTEDPCSYCKAPRQAHVPGKATFGGPDLVFDTAAKALTYGRAMNHNVYGASVHKVSAECRMVTDWTEVQA